MIRAFLAVGVAHALVAHAPLPSASPARGAPAAVQMRTSVIGGNWKINPTTLGEAWRWAKSYRFPEDVCEYAGGDAAAAVVAALDPSAAAVLVYTVAQLVFVLRAVSRVRAARFGLSLPRLRCV